MRASGEGVCTTPREILDAIHASPNKTLAYRRPSDPLFPMLVVSRMGHRSQYFKTYMYDDSWLCTSHEIATALTSVARLRGAYDAAGGYVVTLTAAVSPRMQSILGTTSKRLCRLMLVLS